MVDDAQLKGIAIVGASGNVGASTVKHLLQINSNISITIISQADSTAIFPSSSQITVKKGSYDDFVFLESALRGHDLAMFVLSLNAGGLQPKLIDAAAKAGVQWVIPNEYSADGMNEAMSKANWVLHDKVAARKQIEELGMKWIGVATNPWTEMCILGGLLGFQVQERTATFYAGSGSFNSSSIAQVGRGIARLLSLPVTSSTNPRASLQHYANRFVYISSFLLDQNRIFDAVKRASGTSDADWKIMHSSIQERIADGEQGIAAGKFQGAADKMFAYYMGEGLGGNYDARYQEDKEVLGLYDESLDEVVKCALGS